MPQLSDIKIYAYARNAGFDETTAVTMTAIALAESGGNSDAVSPPNRDGSIDRGLWQINSVHTELINSGNVMDPAGNAAMAKKIYDGQGLNAWSTYSSGGYSLFLSRAQAAHDAWAHLGGMDKLPGAPTPSNAAALNPLKPLFDLVGFVTNTHNWYRVGLFILGLFFVIMSIVKLIGVSRVRDAALSVVTKGAV